MEKKDSKKNEVSKKNNVSKKKDISKKLKKEKVEKKEKKENIFKVIAKYFKGVGKEINRIRWTSGSELTKYSIATLMFVIFFGLYFYAIDWIALLVRSLAK